MIYEFTFENYRSYRHEATIDFTAKPINEFEQSLINGSNGQKLLPVCAIYGPNGGGKVFKGKKMPGQLGGVRVTVQHLQVVRVDTARNLMLVKGGIPGAKGSLVMVQETVKPVK